MKTLKERILEAKADPEFTGEIKDEKGNVWYYKDIVGAWLEKTYDENSNELTYKDSHGCYRINGKKCTKEEYEAFVNTQPETVESIKEEIARLQKETAILQVKLKEMDKSVEVDKDWFDNIIIVRARAEYKNKGFYLSKDYNWSIIIDSEGLNVLVPTRKD